MKTFMVAGAIIGFLIGLTVGLVQQNDWPTILWHAAASAFVLGYLMRWWRRIWIRCLNQAISQKLAAQEEERKDANKATPTKI